MGIFVGGLVQLNPNAGWLQPITEFDAQHFFFFFLPPIIFEAGLNLNRHFFLKNILSVCIYAFVGTLISTFVFAAVIYFSNFFFPNYHIDFLECLIFGSLISATDPVTVLSIFKELHVDIDLYSNVFGERLLFLF